MPGYKGWIDTIDIKIDYYSAFMKAWIAFNAWYNYSGEIEGRNDKEHIDAIAQTSNRFREYIVNLLENVSFPLSNPKFNAESISKFINNYKGKELDKWDIVFVSGSSENKNVINGQEIHSNLRSYDLKQETDENIIRISGAKARLGNPGDPKFRLNKTDMEIAKNKFIEEQVNSRSISNKYYFIPEIKRNPLLMIYFVDLKEPSKYTTNVRRNLVGLGIGIPNLTDEETKFAIYKVNKTYFDLGQNDDYGDEE